MSEHRRLLPITSLPLFIAENPLPVYELHSNYQPLNSFMLKNRENLAALSTITPKTESIMAAEYGNLEEVKKINSVKGKNVRQIQCISAQASFGAYNTGGHQFERPKASITVQKNQQGQLLGNVDLAFEIKIGVEHDSLNGIKATDFKRRQSSVAPVATETNTHDGSSSDPACTSSEDDKGDRSEGQDDLDCQEMQDLKQKDKKMLKDLEDELKYQENLKADKEKVKRQE